MLRENFFLSNQGDRRSAKRKVAERDDDLEWKLLVDTRTEGWVFAGLVLDISPCDPDTNPDEGLHELRWVVHTHGRLRDDEWGSWDRM